MFDRARHRDQTKAHHQYGTLPLWSTSAKSIPREYTAKPAPIHSTALLPLTTPYLHMYIRTYHGHQPNLVYGVRSAEMRPARADVIARPQRDLDLNAATFRHVQQSRFGHPGWKRRKSECGHLHPVSWPSASEHAISGAVSKNALSCCYGVTEVPPGKLVLLVRSSIDIISVSLM